ncbi:hypothetical protein FIBSPDRAFT_854270 [Athelia psychrophila]|uniref:Membrane-associated proteins in eicosanoid and glutathione metabolism n=1 Tax=Athelia psychrophila TaxID=1759441 RepID=A0A166QA08_9AGAM|nr:hypothetical protein FIBSPDRAFT_854270 [Fibularhizoctonia sp. CBS 109695]
MLALINRPLSLYSIPVVWATALVPALLKVVTISSLKGYNNLAPRSNTATLTSSPGVSSRDAARVARMEGASHNGYEAFPLWVAAVLSANYAGLDNSLINKASAAFIGIRILFTYVYIEQTSSAQAFFRSVIWWSGTSVPLYLLSKAANKVYDLRA